MVNKSKPAPSVISPDKEHSTLKMPHQHWWQHLAHDFPEHKAHFSLKLRERLKLTASTATDLGLRAGIIAATTLLSFPMSIRPDVILRDRKERKFYCDLADAGDASQFFIKPKDDIFGSEYANPAVWHINPKMANRFY
jgi:hypothetical protein